MRADDIRARAAKSPRTQIGGPYTEGSTSNVNIYRAGNAVTFTSGMSIDCDGQPGPKCSLSTDPYFQPNTAFNQSNGQPLKADMLPYVVLPLKSSRWDYTSAGIRGGDLCVVAYKDKWAFAVVGDLGPSQRIGEGSYALAELLGINPNPRTGGVASGVTYVVFPGVRVSPIESITAAASVGEPKLAEWLGLDSVPGEEPPVTTPTDPIARFINEAIKTIGMSDQNNTVRTPIHLWYNAEFGNPDPGKYAWDWCDGAVTYWAHKAGVQRAVVFGDRGHFAYTVAHAQAFKDRGRWYPGTSGIRRGDIVFFDWNGQDSIAAIDHVGIVEKVDGGNIHTIEGNYQNRVDRWVRGAYEIAGYGRPDYATGSTNPGDGGGSPVTIVKLADAIAKTAAATRVIQDALNREFGGVVVDGDYGPQTTAAYLRWQQSLGWPGDGVPGAHSLWSLAKKYGFQTDIVGIPAGPGGVPEVPATHTVKRGETLSTIARDFSVPGGWQALYEANKAKIGPDPNSLAVGVELVIPTGSQPTTPTTPDPDPEPEAPTVPVIYLEDAGPNGTVATNKIVQTALNKWKSSPALLVDGIFGPKTSARYREWQESLYGPGPDSDGIPGKSSLTTLGQRAAYRFDVKTRGGSTPTPPASGSLPPVSAYLTQPEPAMDMSRTTYGGKTVNKRTAALLKLAAHWSGVTINLTQGSYNKGVAASAGTHDGGGVVDINVNGWSSSKRAEVVLNLRKAGFAAWLRTPAEGFSYHIHACAIGDRDMASGAKNQVRAYFNRRNGLANNAADNTEHRWPNWADRYK